MISSYFKDIKEVVVTMFDGLTITFSHLFRQPITIQYPDRVPRPVVQTLPERYRGILDFDDAKCIGCLLCMQTCPVDCIYLESVRLEGRKGRAPTIFNIDIGKCMYCGLCSEACPTGAIFHTRQFEGSTEDMDDLMRKYISAGEGEKRKYHSRIEAEQRAEAEAKAKAKAKAEAEAKSKATQGGAGEKK